MQPSSATDGDGCNDVIEAGYEEVNGNGMLGDGNWDLLSS